MAGAEVGEERHGWLAELDGGEGTSGRCGGTKSFCVDPHWGEPEVNEVAVVVAVEPDEGVEETTVVVVTIAVGELGDVGKLVVPALLDRMVAELSEYERACSLLDWSNCQYADRLVKIEAFWCTQAASCLDRVCPSRLLTSAYICVR